MAVSPNNVQHFLIKPDEGKIVIFIDYQSMEATLTIHEIFDPPLTRTLEKRSHESTSGDKEITLDNTPQSYKGCHLVSRHTTTALPSNQYKIVQKVFQANNQDRAIEFLISGKGQDIPVEDSLVVHFD